MRASDAQRLSPISSASRICAVGEYLAENPICKPCYEMRSRFSDNNLLSWYTLFAQFRSVKWDERRAGAQSYEALAK